VLTLDFHIHTSWYDNCNAHAGWSRIILKSVPNRPNDTQYGRIRSSVHVVALGAIPQMEAQFQIPYLSMAALDRYLMPDRNAEIELQS